MTTINLQSIKKINNVNEIVKVLKKLEREFTLTNFRPVIALLGDFPPYSNEIDFEWTSAGSYDAYSTQTLKVGHEPTIGYKIHWKWVTSSNHVVEIHGYLSPNDVASQLEYNQELDGEFTLSIGTDESEEFYPAVREVLN